MSGFADYLPKQGWKQDMFETTSQTLPYINKIN